MALGTPKGNHKVFCLFPQNAIQVSLEVSWGTPPSSPPPERSSTSEKSHDTNDVIESSEHLPEYWNDSSYLDLLEEELIKLYLPVGMLGEDKDLMDTW